MSKYVLNRINLQLFSEEDVDGGQLQPEVKTFTQEDVERIVGERLSRAGIHDMKEIVATLQDMGFQGTPAEIKQAVKQQAEDYKRQLAECQEQERLEALQEQARQEGTSPQLLAKIEKLEAKIAESERKEEAKKAEEEQRRQADAAWKAEVQEFEEAYPDVDLIKLNENDKFIRFIKGKRLPLKELYEDYVELIGETAAEAMAKVKSKEERSTSSGKSAKNSDGNTYGLTEAQKREVDEWNKRFPKMAMSYKDYANR